jgi:hypothetical protein
MMHSLQSALPGTSRPQKLRRSTRRCSTTTELEDHSAPSTPPPPSAAAADSKAALLRLVAGTNRGLYASREQRILVQEAALALEGGFGAELDLEKLAGKWVLQYTSASDVLVLLEAERASFGLLSVGEISQSFDTLGNVENGIEARTFPLASTQLRVRARYERAGARSLRLAFTEACVGDVVISPELEALIAPALLPRTAPQMLILQALRSFNLTLPLPGIGRSVLDSEESGSGLLGGAVLSAGAYLLGFCDDEVLVGRALTGGGLFIFTRG